MLRDAAEEDTIRVEGVDEAESLTVNIIRLVRVLLGIGHEDPARNDGCDAERREPAGDLRIDEPVRERDRLECSVEDVHLSVVKVGRIEPRARVGRHESEPFVARSGGRIVDGDHGLIRTLDGHGRRPSGDGSALAGEDEASGG